MAKSRDVAKEGYWREVIRRFEASGLGVRRFCAQEGLSEDRLYWWRRTLRRRHRRPVACPRQSGAGKADPCRSDRQRESSFLPVAFPVSLGGTIEIVHPRGHVIRVPAIFDPAVLGNVLAAIDAPASVSGEK
jgi:hypothetical protein